MKFSWWNRANLNKIKFTPTSSEEFRRTYVERILEANITNFNNEKEWKEVTHRGNYSCFRGDVRPQRREKNKECVVIIIILYI